MSLQTSNKSQRRKAFWEISLFPNLAIKNRVVNEVILRDRMLGSPEIEFQKILSLLLLWKREKSGGAEAQRTAVEAAERG